MIQQRSQQMKQWWNVKPNQTLVWLLMGGLLVRSFIAFLLPPGFDEAYYYLYTQNLHWSYFDHPLMVAYTTGFGVWLTGEVSQFTIRLGPLLLYVGSLIFLYLTSARLFSVKAGVMTVAIASLIPIFVVGFGVMTLPDSPLIFFWSATLYVASTEFFRHADYRPSYRLAIMGLLVGLACLSKYHGLAIGFGLVAFCLTSRNHRIAFRSPWTLLATTLFLVAISPIIIWNLQHDWVSLRYQSGRAVPDRGYNLLELLSTFLIGVAYLFPTFGFPLWWVSLREMGSKRSRGARALESEGVGSREWGSKGAEEQGAGREGGDATQNSKLKAQSLKLPPSSPHPFIPSPLHPLTPSPSAFLLWLSLPLILGFTLMGGYRPILPTWAMPGFWGATVLLGQRSALWQEQAPRAVRRWLWGSGLVIGALLLVALLHLSFGTLQQPSRFAWFGGLVPASADASVQLVDIEQIRQGFQTSPDLKAALQRSQFVFTNEIFLSGQVGMAIAPLNPPPITTFNDDLRGFAFWSTAEQWVGKNGLYITSSRLADADFYRDYFQSIQKVGEIPLQRGGVTVETMRVYECKNLLKPFPRPYDVNKSTRLR